MALIEGESIFGMGQGCDLHGDDRMRECGLCGIEFCALCYPRSAVCPGCVSDALEDELEDEEADFEEDDSLGELLDFDDATPASGD